MNVQPTSPKEPHPAWIWIAAAVIGFAGIVGVVSASRETFQMISPAVAGVGLAGVAILLIAAFRFRARLEATHGVKIFFRAATGLAALGAVFAGTLAYSSWHRQPRPDTPTVPSVTSKTASPTQLPPTPSPPTLSATIVPVHHRISPTSLPMSTPSLAPSPSPQPTRSATPRIDWRAELASGRPVILQIFRDPFGPGVEVIEGEKYRIRFDPATCVWETRGTINHQQYGIVENFVCHTGPGLQPLYGRTEMNAQGACVTPASHLLLLLHIQLQFDANGFLADRNGKYGRLERAAE